MSEDFDGIGLNLDIDSLTFSISNITSLDENYGVIKLSDSILLSELSTQVFNAPLEGAPVYLELDYFCNTQFLVGIYVNFPQSAVLRKDLLWINEKEEWNKIYINLTSAISEAVGAEGFKIFIEVNRDFSKNENTVNIDNLKIIY